MKIEKLVRITAKSECMDIEVVMTSKKATAYVKKLKKIQEEWLDSVTRKEMVPYTPRYRWGVKRMKPVKVVPDGVDGRIKIKVEPAGEILN